MCKEAPMTNHTRASRYTRLFGGLAALMLALAALLTAPSAEALRSRSSGAGNCGDFKESIDQADPGDVLIPMVDGDGGRNTLQAVINVDDLTVEGGWTPPGTNCPTTNYSTETPAELLAAGFNYQGLDARSHLFTFGAPAVRVDAAVKKLTVINTSFRVIDSAVAQNGGGLSATGMISANLRLTQVGFYVDPDDAPLSITGSGGGLYLDIDGGSRVTIDGATFERLRAATGGGFEIVVRGGSHVTLKNLVVRNNHAEGGAGGGGRIIIHSGHVTITDSLFEGNTATAPGSQLSIERVGTAGPASATLINTTFGAAPALVDTPLSVTGDGLTFKNLNRRLFHPRLASFTGAPRAIITNIVRNSNTYSATFITEGFTPALPGQHVHFFYDTVPPAQAGMPGDGPWFVYGSSAPFTQATVANRPFGATKLCILVANPDHSVIQGTGNCVTLPSLFLPG
jgi:hypothetical protein